MNYYSFHIGDYLTRTSHLTLVEHGAYRRMIDVYYSTEKPLPGDIKSICRLVMARTKEERDAVDAVLNEFFELVDGLWVNDRCEHEIGLCNKNRSNGKKGGRPPKTDNPDETQKKPKRNPDETQTEPNPNPTQKPPLPITHYPLPITQEQAHAVVDSTVVTPAGTASARMRQAGLQDANPQHPRLIALIAAGITADELAQAATEAVQRGKGFAYALATAEGRRRDAASVGALPDAKPETTPRNFDDWVCGHCGKPASRKQGSAYFCADHDSFSHIGAVA